MNGYPARIVNQRHPSRQMTPPDTEPLRATVVVPYIRNLSESIRSVLIPLRIRTYFKPHQTLSQILVHPKDPVPPRPTKGCCIQDPQLRLWNDVCWSDWTYPPGPQERTYASTHKLWCNDLGFSRTCYGHNSQNSMGRCSGPSLRLVSPSSVCHWGMAYSISTFTDKQRSQSSPSCLQ